MRPNVFSYTTYFAASMAWSKLLYRLVDKPAILVLLPDVVLYLPYNIVAALIIDM